MANLVSLSEDFEVGSAGSAISSLSTIFDSHTGGGNSTVITSDAYVGTRAAHAQPGGTDFRLHRADLTGQSTLWVSFYFKPLANPTTSTAIFLFYNGTTKIGDVRMIAGGSTLQLRSINSNVWTSTALTLNEWHRIAVQIAPTAGGNGTLRLRIYSGAGRDGSTPSQDSGAQTATATVATVDNIRLGTASADATLSYNFDRIRGDDASEPAGYTAPGTPPTAQAGTDQNVNSYATVMLDGSGSTNGSGVIDTYTWSQTGGSPTVTLAGSGASRSFTAPATVSGTTLTFQLLVSDDLAASDTDTMDVVVAPHDRFVVAPDGTTRKGLRRSIITS